jgi:hypothetical protein
MTFWIIAATTIILLTVGLLALCAFFFYQTDMPDNDDETDYNDRTG